MPEGHSANGTTHTTRIFIDQEPNPGRQRSVPVYETANGAMYHGKAEEILRLKRLEKIAGRVRLIFTSPPYPLARGKKYGNEIGEDYIEWLASYAKQFRDYILPTGSIVIELGNTWVPGKPTMSTTVMRALLKFLDAAELHLCEEFIWYNPARLPSPTVWVNVERIRVKDSFTRIWWMSPVDRPKADNRRVLRPYSRSMEQLLKTGKYNAGRRPSEHGIGLTSFTANNGGAIPANVFQADDAPGLSNLLKCSNTKSSDQYHLFCEENGIKKHPARMPAEIAEFFIKFLTDEDEIVLDPFAGSNTTGAVAERLNRQWVSVEEDWSYVRGSFGHFPLDHLQKVGPEILLVDDPNFPLRR
jgi:site-specific DNA-methyltransferase (cytosine-N4-specific)